PLDVNTEPWFWARELMMHFPGRIGTAYRSRFYNHYFKRRSASLVILPGVCIEHPHELVMGDGVAINRNVWLNAVGGLTIGDNCGIGPGTIIHTANHNYNDPNTPWAQQGWTYKPVVLEDDVWLAASVMVLPGTIIGKGAIVVAGATISGNVEPYAVMAGNPARKIGSRQPMAMKAASAEH